MRNFRPEFYRWSFPLCKSSREREPARAGMFVYICVYMHACVNRPELYRWSFSLCKSSREREPAGAGGCACIYLYMHVCVDRPQFYIRSFVCVNQSWWVCMYEWMNWAQRGIMYRHMRPYLCLCECTLISIMTVYFFSIKKTQVQIPEPKHTASIFVLGVRYQCSFFCA
jgi:hypothetical protein